MSPLLQRASRVTVSTAAAAAAAAALIASPASPAAASAARTADGSAPVGSTAYPVPSGAIYVSPSGSDRNPGTLAAPLRTVAHAVVAAPAGGTVVLRAGTYHEDVQLPVGKRLTVQSAPGEAAWLDGSVPVTGWVKDSGGGWRKDGWTYHFDTVTAAQSGSPYFKYVNQNHPMAGYPDEVFYDGKELAQVGSRSAVVPGTFYVDTAAHQLFLGDDPSGHQVAASTLQEALAIRGGDGTVVRGIGIRRYATPVDGIATVKVNANNVTMENVVVTDNATRAINVGDAHVTLNQLTVTHNGDMGIGGNEADYLTVSNSVVSGNNSEYFNVAPVAGGMKFTRCRYTTIRHDTIDDNIGNGLWFDQSSYQGTIIDNLVQRNSGPGIHWEISGYALIADNLITDSGARGLLLADANNVRVWNNTIANNYIAMLVIDGPRNAATDKSDPGHDPRHPNDPNITWVTGAIQLRNNIIDRGAWPSLLGTEDVNRTKTASSMVSTDYNAYYRPSTSAPKWVITWCNYGHTQKMLLFTDLPSFVRTVGQEKHSQAATGGTDPYVTNAAAGDYSMPAASPARAKGQPLPSDVAAAIGVAAGQPVNMGMVTP